MSSKTIFDRIKSTTGRNIKRGAVLISVAIILSLILGVIGCSGSHKLNPTDPVASKQKKQPPQGETGGLSDTGSQTGRGSGFWGSDDPSLDLLRELIYAGGGQGGGIFDTHVTVGVFDRLTLEPIINAVVCVGNDGEHSSVIGAEGIVTMTIDVSDPPPATEFIDEAPSEPDNFYITAGADGYEMQSYQKLTNNNVAFLLNPLNPPSAGVATVSGRFVFPTVDFYADVYATNVISVVDGTLEPPGGGELYDTFELTVEAGKPGVFLCVVREPDAGIILSIYHTAFEELDPGAEHVIESVVPENNPLGFDGSGSPDWVDYTALKTQYQGIILFPDTGLDIPSNKNIYYSLNAKNCGIINFSDYIFWSCSNNKCAYTTDVVNLLNYLPFQTMQLRISVVYDDGSGSDYTIARGTLLKSGVNTRLPSPPVIHNPNDGDLGVTLNARIEWESFSSMPKVISLVDTINGNRWLIHSNVGASNTELPTLCGDMTGWGLTVANPVEVVIEESLPTPILNEDGSFDTNNQDATDRSYSGTKTFTP